MFRKEKKKLIEEVVVPKKDKEEEKEEEEEKREEKEKNLRLITDTQLVNIKLDNILSYLTQVSDNIEELNKIIKKEIEREQ